jgi:hypothetical protein
MGTLKIVWVSTYNKPLQNSPTNSRGATSRLQEYTAAHTKYTMMLRFVSWTASHTFVLPVSS